MNRIEKKGVGATVDLGELYIKAMDNSIFNRLHQVYRKWNAKRDNSLELVIIIVTVPAAKPDPTLKFDQAAVLF
jgi:hypothetical protein